MTAAPELLVRRPSESTDDPSDAVLSTEWEGDHS